MPLQQRTIGFPGSLAHVGQIGYGLMGTPYHATHLKTGFTFPNFAPRSTPLSDEEAFSAMKAAIDGGATFWNGGAYYGFGPKGELLNLELVARFFDRYPELADKVFLSVKGGFNVAKYSPDGDPEFLRSDVDSILRALNGKKKLDLFEMGRVDRTRYFPLISN
jgi:pyridoxine 4-dehydrogenase